MASKNMDAQWLDQFILMVEEFRKFNRDCTANHILTFLHVAREPGISQKALLEKLGMVSGGQSRAVAALSKYGDRGTPGWEVLRLDENPLDRRMKEVSLTPRGRAVLNTLKTIGGRFCRALERSEVNV